MAFYLNDLMKEMGVEKVKEYKLIPRERNILLCKASCRACHLSVVNDITLSEAAEEVLQEAKNAFQGRLEFLKRQQEEGVSICVDTDSEMLRLNKEFVLAISAGDCLREVGV